MKLARSQLLQKEVNSCYKGHHKAIIRKGRQGRVIHEAQEPNNGEIRYHEGGYEADSEHEEVRHLQFARNFKEVVQASN